jgi:hypothetical protein
LFGQVTWDKEQRRAAQLVSFLQSRQFEAEDMCPIPSRAMVLLRLEPATSDDDKSIEGSS